MVSLPAFLHPSHQGQVCCVAQARCVVHSPKCYSRRGVGPDLWKLVKGGGKEGHLSLVHATTQAAGQVQHNVWTSTWPQVSAQTMDLHHTTFGGSSGHRDQHRAQLQQEHGPRHGPQCQPSPQTSRCPQVVAPPPHIPVPQRHAIMSPVPRLSTVQESLGFLSHLSPTYSFLVVAPAPGLECTLLVCFSGILWDHFYHMKVSMFWNCINQQMHSK